MIAQVAENIPSVKTRKRLLTYEDYARLTPLDSGNYELHNGQIIYMPSPIPRHQDLAGEIYSDMKSFAKTRQSGKVYIAPLDTFFDKFNTLQPDVLFISAGRLDIIGAKKIEAAPDLVVEVLSEGNKPEEMLHKKQVYETFGVREYWLINIEKETVTQYLLQDGEFESRRITFDEDLVSVALPGYTVRLRNILP